MRKSVNLQSEFQELLEAHGKIVTKISNSYAKTTEDRKDLSQEICVQLWRSFQAFDRSKTFSTWMFRISLNVAISFARKHSLRGANAADFDQTTIESIPNVVRHDSDDRSEALYELIKSLDELNRAVLILHLEDQSYAEIGEIMGLSETNVATKISRLKERLKKQVNQQVKQTWN
jgi:RNA polymerase sigma factor (sigma-70 family)